MNRKVEFYFTNVPKNKYVGWFHEWTQLSGDPKAIIETADGKIIIMPYTNIRFLDRIDNEKMVGSSNWQESGQLVESCLVT